MSIMKNTHSDTSKLPMIVGAQIADSIGLFYLDTGKVIVVSMNFDCTDHDWVIYSGTAIEDWETFDDISKNVIGLKIVNFDAWDDQNSIFLISREVCTMEFDNGKNLIITAEDTSHFTNLTEYSIEYSNMTIRVVPVEDLSNLAKREYWDWYLESDPNTQDGFTYWLHHLAEYDSWEEDITRLFVLPRYFKSSFIESNPNIIAV